jgi:TetR/AcrR family transcriptional regulator
MIWAVTQHYADFAVQVRSILGVKADCEPEPALLGGPTILSIFFDGLRPR